LSPGWRTEDKRYDPKNARCLRGFRDIYWKMRLNMLLVIDIGTSTFKAALVKYDGSGEGFVRLPLTVKPGNGPKYETDPGQWLRAFGEAAARLGPLKTVEAIIISGNGPTLAPVLGPPALTDGELSLPSAPARLWLDRRAEEEARIVSPVMGGFVDPSFFLPKALAVKNREPELYEKTRWFLAAPEYLVYALTGEARTVFPSEGFERWYWNGPALKALGLDADKFPPLVFPGEFIGTLTRAVASRFGFKSRVKVFAGGPDFFVAILGTGAVKPGLACDRAGTSEGINLCCRNKVDDNRLLCYGHPVKPYWNLSGPISTTGEAVAWGKKLLGMAGIPHASLSTLAKSAPAGAGGLVFLPYLAGERAPIWDPHARGVFLGLSLGTGREEIARAITEGICFAIRDVITVMEETGATVEELRVTGKPGESAYLNQLKADITGRPVLIPALKTAVEPLPAELLGLTALGTSAMGIYGSAAEAVLDLVTIMETFLPDEGKKPIYDQAFETYREAYRALKTVFEKNKG
jgi:xylulokinase